ncbi:MAG: hypothetical protein ACRD2S_11820, partial [Terriglobales bacterium]
MILFSRLRSLINAAMIGICLLAIAPLGYAQAKPQSLRPNEPSVYGPFNGVFLAGGDGLEKPLAKDDDVLRADSPWSLYGWVKPAESLEAPTLVAGFGYPA